MLKRTTIVLMLAAGTAAADEPQLLTNYDLIPTDRIGHIYYNAATGEMTRTYPGAQRNDSQPVWVNDRLDQCGFGGFAALPMSDSATGEDIAAVDFGGIEANSCIDCITIFYATSLPDPEEDGEDGYSLKFVLFEGFDLPSSFSGLSPFLNFELAIPGSASGITSWLITLDLSGANTFELGNTNGQSDCGTAFFDNGRDTNGDGIPDFAFGFAFTHPEGATEGRSWIPLVVPPGGVEPNILADEDILVLANRDEFCDLQEFIWFGGYDCDPADGEPWNPWASFFLGLYGSSPLACPPDLNADGLLDFFDVQLFLSAFAAQNPLADFNDDQLFDFFDLQLFLTQFTASCP